MAVDPDDPRSIDLRLVRALCRPVDRFMSWYFKHDVRGLDRVPDGPALLVGNHNSGVMFLEPLGFGARWYRDHTSDHDLIHALTHDVLMDAPGVGEALGRIGGVRATHEAAARVFGLGRKVLVFPGGNLEAFRPASRRTEVDFNGRKGWVRLALRHRVPIVPIAFHGGHDSFRILSDNRRLAKWIGAKRFLRSDTWPLWVGLPWGIALGPWPHLPLPVRCVTEVLDPVATAPHGPDQITDDDVLADLYNQVTGALESALQRLEAERVT